MIQFGKPKKSQTLFLTDELRNKLEQLATMHDRSLSAELRFLIREAELPKE